MREEIAARWCLECGMDLFLSDEPLVISKHRVICDVCRGLNRDAYDLERVTWRRMPPGLAAHEFWPVWRWRLRWLRTCSGGSGYECLVKLADDAIKNQNAPYLLKILERAIRSHVCLDWDLRLKTCRAEVTEFIEREELEA